jgi:hypothetical protein
VDVGFQVELGDCPFDKELALSNEVLGKFFVCAALGEGLKASEVECKAVKLIGLIILEIVRFKSFPVYCH